MNHNYTAINKNVKIRQVTCEDLEKLRLWRNDKKNTKYLSDIPLITSDMQKKWFENYLNNENEIIFAIEEIVELNTLVGSMALYNFEESSAEFGKILIGESNAHGKKIGQNSIEAILEFAFFILNLSYVFLHVYAENTPAIKVYKNVGFQEEERYNTKNGKEILMTINKVDYSKVRGRNNGT